MKALDPLVRPWAGLVVGLLGGAVFAALLFVLETAFHLAVGLEPRSGHGSALAWVLSYLVPCTLLGALLGALLPRGRGVARPLRAVWTGLLVALVLAIGGVEALDRAGMRGSLPARLGVGVGLVGSALAGFAIWTRRGRGRLPILDHRAPWIANGLAFGGLVAVTLVYQAHGQIFSDPLAPASLLGSIGILAGSLGAGLAASFLAARVGERMREASDSRFASRARRAAVPVSLVGAALVVVGLIGVTGPGSGVPSDEEPPRGVILIVADTLRADAVGAYSASPDDSETPNIDAIARDGVLFESCTASANWTLPSFASMFTSLHPSQHGAGANPGPGTSFDAMRDDVPTLAGMLSERGIRTHALVNNTYLLPAFGLDRGFDEYRMLRAVPDHQALSRILVTLGGTRTLPYAPAESVAAEFRDELERIVRAGRPFFLVVQLMDAHAPYLDRETGETYPDRGPRLATPEGLEAARKAYRSEVRHLDRSVGEMRREIDRRGLGDSTLVVFAADHGEEFGEHGGTGHGRALYEESIQVPLIVAGSGVRGEGRRATGPVGLVDLMPTILDWWGIVPPEGIQGRSLRGDLAQRDRAAGTGDRGERKGSLRSFLAESCYQLEKKMVRFGRFKLIHNVQGGADPYELYDLAFDPAELRNLASEASTELGLLRGILEREASLRAGAPGSDGGGGPDLGREAKERLRALGYLEPADM
jgi:arylsulfatase A-like enzyme